ncbi:hypothetical protein [Thalassoglobus neptunius]|uniref:hypothetical protein n=1 Tax=Thalassoglobus neptunius TaxID=1938619 RepID=UPI0011B68FB9|nr:hypothetical protein [Thalassoglobus neptunius]
MKGDSPSFSQCFDNNPAIDQFVDASIGLFNGALAAHYLQGKQSNFQLATKLADPIDTDAEIEVAELLRRCFCHYHQAWDLYTPKVSSIVGSATAKPNPDRATAILDEFSKSKNQDSLPEWWTQSNWLLVRRLLSYLLGDDDPTQVDELPENTVQMLAAQKNGNEYKGQTAPVTTSARPEGWPSAYLDPIALGLTVLDKDMLNSLRIATRICRSDLRNADMNISLRIALQPGQCGILGLSGDSAGGLVTVAACATATKHRLDRRASASFTVNLKDDNDLETLKNDVSIELKLEDVTLGPVGSGSIEAKLRSEAFQNRVSDNGGSDNGESIERELNRVYLHHTQKSESQKPEEWMPRVEQSLGIKIRTVGGKDRKDVPSE